MSLHSMGTVETGMAVMSLSSKTKWDPGSGLRQAWDRPSLQGISREVEGHGGGRCWEASLLVSQCRRRQATAEDGDGGSGQGGWRLWGEQGESIGAMMLWSESASSKGRSSGVSRDPVMPAV